MNLDSMLTMEQSQLKKTIAKFTKKIAVQIGASKSANTKYIEPKIQHVLDFKTLQNICAVQYLVWRHISESGNCHVIKKWYFFVLCYRTQKPKNWKQKARQNDPPHFQIKNLFQSRDIFNIARTLIWTICPWKWKSCQISHKDCILKSEV